MKDITFPNTINRFKISSCPPFTPKLADLAENVMPKGAEIRQSVFVTGLRNRQSVSITGLRNRQSVSVTRAYR